MCVGLGHETVSAQACHSVCTGSQILSLASQFGSPRVAPCAIFRLQKVLRASEGVSPVPGHDSPILCRRQMGSCVARGHQHVHPESGVAEHRAVQSGTQAKCCLFDAAGLLRACHTAAVEAAMHLQQCLSLGG